MSPAQNHTQSGQHQEIIDQHHIGKDPDLMVVDQNHKVGALDLMVVDHDPRVADLDQDHKEGGPGHQDDGQDLEIKLKEKRCQKGKRKSIPPVEIEILLRLK